MAAVKPKAPSKKMQRELGATAATMTDAEADALIGQFGEANRQLAQLEIQMNAALAALKAEYEVRAHPHNETRMNLYARLFVWANKNRKRLTDEGKVKTARLPSGAISWADRPASVRLSDGLKAEDVIAEIERLLPKKPEYAAFIRLVPELNKQAMRDDEDLAETLTGVTIGSAGESFTVEPFGAELAELKT